MSTPGGQIQAHGGAGINEEVVRFFEESQIAIHLSAADLRKLHAAVERAIDAGTEAADLVTALAGADDATGIAGHFRIVMLMGAGYFRGVKGLIGRLFKERNSRRRKAPRAMTHPKEAKPC